MIVAFSFVTFTHAVYCCLISWRFEEAGHYLATFKQFEFKPPDLIKERIDRDYYTILRTALTTISKVNKTDVETLKTSFNVRHVVKLFKTALWLIYFRVSQMFPKSQLINCKVFPVLVRLKLKTSKMHSKSLSETKQPPPCLFRKRASQGLRSHLRQKPYIMTSPLVMYPENQAPSGT